MNGVLLTCAGGTVEVPGMPLIGRADGGHLVVNPPRAVWERSELAPQELSAWSFLVAATGQAMLAALPQLAGGCVNYWEAGNWSLHHDAPPVGPKEPRDHRRVHLHLFGRSPRATDPSWLWGEAPRFPSYREREPWAAGFEPLSSGECDAIVESLVPILRERYSLVSRVGAL